MLRRTVSVSPTSENEARLPASCLAELGFTEGAQAVLQVSRGRLLLTEAREAHELQRDAEGFAEQVESLQAQIGQWAQRLPEIPEEIAEGDLPSNVESELRFAAECVLNDDLRTAIQRLRSAAAVTDEQLREQWSQERATKKETSPRK